MRSDQSNGSAETLTDCPYCSLLLLCLMHYQLGQVYDERPSNSTTSRHYGHLQRHLGSHRDRNERQTSQGSHGEG